MPGISGTISPEYPLFKLNIEWYPESSNVYDSYADYYLAQKDTANAVTNYQKALQIKDNTETRSKLNALNNKGTMFFRDKPEKKPQSGMLTQRIVVALEHEDKGYFNPTLFTFIGR